MTFFEPPLASLALLIGRIGLAMIYLVSGVHKGIWYNKAVEEFRVARIPVIGVLLPMTIGLHLIGSICLILGVFVTESALILAAFTALATVKVHQFWRLTGMQRLIISRVALANFGVMGGLLILAATGPGQWALASAG